jgi:hypothetical protein
VTRIFYWSNRPRIRRLWTFSEFPF